MKLLITGAYRCGDKEKEYIKSLGNEIFYMQDEKAPLELDPEEIEGVICNGLFLYHPIEKFTKLKYIQLTSAGSDRVPMEYIKEKGIEIHSAKGVYSIPMAEYAVWGVLLLMKHTSLFYENQKTNNWNKLREIEELYGKTVCIVGAGSVGTETAKRFKAFGADVLGVCLKKREIEYFDRIYSSDELNKVLPEADIVILTLPYTKENEHLFDKEKFSAMKENAIFVNMARGNIVNEKALTEALKENRIGGAVLDVFEEEPLDRDSPLWDFENVIITPHNSFVGSGNSGRLFKLITENLSRYGR